jgi:hypothetical protein
MSAIFLQQRPDPAAHAPVTFLRPQAQSRVDEIDRDAPAPCAPEIVRPDLRLDQDQPPRLDGVKRRRHAPRKIDRVVDHQSQLVGKLLLRDGEAGRRRGRDGHAQPGPQLAQPPDQHQRDVDFAHADRMDPQISLQPCTDGGREEAEALAELRQQFPASPQLKEKERARDGEECDEDHVVNGLHQKTKSGFHR